MVFSFYSNRTGGNSCFQLCYKDDKNKCFCRKMQTLEVEGSN